MTKDYKDKGLPLGKQVANLKLSKQLAELLGDNAPESLFWHHNGKVLTKWEIRGRTVSEENKPTRAYTTAELSYFIGQAANGEYVVIEHDEGAMAYHVYERIMESEELTLTRTGYKLEVIKNAGLMAETAADTWAKLAIYLLTHNLPNNQ